MDARQHHHDEDVQGCAQTLPLDHRRRDHPFFAGRTTKCSRCGELRLAVPSTGESPAWGKRGFLGKQGLGGSTCLKDTSVDVGERFKTTTPPERNMFARRRCRRNWIRNSPVQLCPRNPEKVQRPAQISRGVFGKPEPEPASKQNCSQASRSSSNACSASTSTSMTASRSSLMVGTGAFAVSSTARWTLACVTAAGTG